VRYFVEIHKLQTELGASEAKGLLILKHGVRVAIQIATSNSKTHDS